MWEEALEVFQELLVTGPRIDPLKKQKLPKNVNQCFQVREDETTSTLENASRPASNVWRHFGYPYGPGIWGFPSVREVAIF